MIKLSDVKVRPQYRTRARYRLVVAGVCVGTRSRRSGPALWTQRSDDSAVAEALAARGCRGAVPSYPRHRARRVSPAAAELIRHARQEFGYGAARTRLWLQRVHGIRLAMGTIQRVF